MRGRFAVSLFRCAGGYTAPLRPRIPKTATGDLPAICHRFHPPGSPHPVERAPHAASYRVTLTLPVLNQAAFVLFLVAGEDKAEAARLVLDEGKPLPAGLVKPRDGRLVWLLDRAAASKLEIGRAHV